MGALTLSNNRRRYFGPVVWQEFLAVSTGTADAMTFTDIRCGVGSSGTDGFNRAFFLSSTPINTGASNAQIVPNSTVTDTRVTPNGQSQLAVAMAGGANTDRHTILLATW